MNLQFNPIVVPIPYDSGPSRPMTESECAGFIAAIIAIHIFFILCNVVALIMYYYREKGMRNPDYTIWGFLEYVEPLTWTGPTFIGMFNLLFAIFLFADFIGGVGYLIYNMM